MTKKKVKESISQQLREHEEQQQVAGGYWWETPEICEKGADTIDNLESALLSTAASLNAAISLLENGGKAGAPSDKMFEQMIEDYKGSLLNARRALWSVNHE